MVCQCPKVNISVEKENSAELCFLGSGELGVLSSKRERDTSVRSTARVSFHYILQLRSGHFGFSCFQGPMDKKWRHLLFRGTGSD